MGENNEGLTRQANRTLMKKACSEAAGERRAGHSAARPITTILLTVAGVFGVEQAITTIAGDDIMGGRAYGQTLAKQQASERERMFKIKSLHLQVKDEISKLNTLIKKRSRDPSPKEAENLVGMLARIETLLRPFHPKESAPLLLEPTGTRGQMYVSLRKTFSTDGGEKGFLPLNGDMLSEIDKKLQGLYMGAYVTLPSRQLLAEVDMRRQKAATAAPGGALELGALAQAELAKKKGVPAAPIARTPLMEADAAAVSLREMQKNQLVPPGLRAEATRLIIKIRAAQKLTQKGRNQKAKDSARAQLELLLPKAAEAIAAGKDTEEASRVAKQLRTLKSLTKAQRKDANFYAKGLENATVRYARKRDEANKQALDLAYENAANRLAAAGTGVVVKRHAITIRPAGASDLLTGAEAQMAGRYLDRIIAIARETAAEIDASAALAPQQKKDLVRREGAIEERLAAYKRKGELDWRNLYEMRDIVVEESGTASFLLSTGKFIGKNGGKPENLTVAVNKLLENDRIAALSMCMRAAARANDKVIEEVSKAGPQSPKAVLRTIADMRAAAVSSIVSFNGLTYQSEHIDYVARGKKLGVGADVYARDIQVRVYGDRTLPLTPERFARILAGKNLDDEDQKMQVVAGEADRNIADSGMRQFIENIEKLSSDTLSKAREKRNPQYRAVVEEARKLVAEAKKSGFKLDEVPLKRVGKGKKATTEPDRSSDVYKLAVKLAIAEANLSQFYFGVVDQAEDAIRKSGLAKTDPMVLALRGWMGKARSLASQARKKPADAVKRQAEIKEATDGIYFATRSLLALRELRLLVENPAYRRGDATSGDVKAASDALKVAEGMYMANYGNVGAGKRPNALDVVMVANAAINRIAPYPLALSERITRQKVVEAVENPLTAGLDKLTSEVWQMTLVGLDPEMRKASAGAPRWDLALSRNGLRGANQLIDETYGRTAVRYRRLGISDLDFVREAVLFEAVANDYYGCLRDETEFKRAPELARQGAAVGELLRQEWLRGPEGKMDYPHLAELKALPQAKKWVASVAPEYLAKTPNAGKVAGTGNASQLSILDERLKDAEALVKELEEKLVGRALKAEDQHRWAYGRLLVQSARDAMSAYRAAAYEEKTDAAGKKKLVMKAKQPNLYSHSINPNQAIRNAEAGFEMLKGIKVDEAMLRIPRVRLTPVVFPAVNKGDPLEAKVRITLNKRETIDMKTAAKLPAFNLYTVIYEYATDDPKTCKQFFALMPETYKPTETEQNSDVRTTVHFSNNPAQKGGFYMYVYFVPGTKTLMDAKDGAELFAAGDTDKVDAFIIGRYELARGKNEKGEIVNKPKPLLNDRNKDYDGYLFGTILGRELVQKKEYQDLGAGSRDIVTTIRTHSQGYARTGKEILGVWGDKSIQR